MNIKHILLPTDLSEESRRPFDDVFELAALLGARVTLLFVVEDLLVAPHGAALAPPQSAPDTPRKMQDARAALEQLCKELGTKAGLQADVISHGTISKGIVAYVREHDVDLVAISTHGRTGFRRLAIGSVAEAVLRHSPVPVMSFHRNED